MRRTEVFADEEAGEADATAQLNDDAAPRHRRHLLVQVGAQLLGGGPHTLPALCLEIGAVGQEEGGNEVRWR